MTCLNIYFYILMIFYSLCFQINISRIAHSQLMKLDARFRRHNVYYGFIYI
jgi:hypothetical protein